MTEAEILEKVFRDGINVSDCTIQNMSWLGDNVTDEEVILAYIHLRRMPEIHGLKRENGVINYRLKEKDDDVSFRTSVLLRLVAELHYSINDKIIACQYLSQHPERVVNADLINSDTLRTWVEYTGLHASDREEGSNLYLDMTTTPKFLICNSSKIPPQYIVVARHNAARETSVPRFGLWKVGERLRLEDQMLVAVSDYYRNRVQTLQSSRTGE